MPKVSVIIPTYNRSQLVKEAIDSVLCQQLADIEVVVIDDGSIDDTASIVKTFDDPRIRYYYKDNEGVSSARNVGLNKATGEYIAFLDSDDLWPHSYLNIMVSAIDRTDDYGVVYATIDQHFPDGSVVNKWGIGHCVSGWVTAQLFHNSFVYCPSTVVRRSVLNGLYFDKSLEIDEDYDFFLKLSLRTKFLFVPDVQVVRRVQENSLSRQGGARKVSINKAMVLERLYYNLGGKEVVPKAKAMNEISQIYRKVGRQYCKIGARKAAVYLLRQSVFYNKFKYKNYYNLMKAVLKYRCSDTMPDWQFPNPLPLINVELPPNQNSQNWLEQHS